MAYKLNNLRQKAKKQKSTKRFGMSKYGLLTILLVVGLVSIVFLADLGSTKVMQPAGTTTQIETCSVESAQIRSNQTVDIKPSFNVQVTYAYVGPLKDHFTCQNPLQGKMSIKTLNAKSLYPVVVYFNFTHISKAEVESSDAKMEVYLIDLKTNTGTAESYVYTEATNYDPAFSDLNLLSSHIEDFNEVATAKGLSGGFTFNWTTNTSILDGKAGSYGSYGSKPSGFGLWSAGEPNTITLSVRRIGVISVDGKYVSTITDVNSQNCVQIQLEKYDEGFLYNTVVPEQTLAEINPFHPPSPKT